MEPYLGGGLNPSHPQSQEKIMKNCMRNLIVALALLALSTLNTQYSTCFAQGGNLTPSGPPGPTMFSLSQVMTTLNQNEPRRPIPGAPFYIVQPGSYYLTTNLTVTSGDAIDIEASGVTLDLNGFTISSTSPSDSGTAIYISFIGVGGYTGFTDITIFNGHITGGVTNKAGVYGGPGFYNGISYFQAPPVPPYNVRVTGVTVSGCENSGINAGTGNSTVVESCAVNSVGGYGIVASSVTHSTAYQCGNTAIMADTASDCYGYCTGSGDGLYVTYAVNNCYGNCNGSGSGLIAFTVNNCFGNCLGAGFGIYAFNANNCYAGSTSGIGLDVSAGVATGCYGTSSGPGDGLDATAANNCYGYSTGAGNGLNVSQTATGCYGYSGGNGNGLEASAANTCSGYANGSGDGLHVTNNAENCYGTSSSGTGLFAEAIAIGCSGYSASGVIGLNVGGSANSCFGVNSANGFGLYVGGSAISCEGSSTSGVGISANIANSCTLLNGTESITYKYNMP
jgi:hypothetical protein